MFLTLSVCLKKETGYEEANYYKCSSGDRVGFGSNTDHLGGTPEPGDGDRQGPYRPCHH